MIAAFTRRLASPDTWPEIRVTILPLPWTWRRPCFYRDEESALLLTYVTFGPLWIEWGGQEGGWRNQFTETRQDPAQT